MRGPRRHGLSRQEGAAATEFALILPLLIILFFGIVQVGITVFRAQVVEAAAREGARAASVGENTGAVTAVARSTATAFDPTKVGVTVSECTGGASETTVTVFVPLNPADTTYDFEIPFVGSFTPTFSSTAVFQCEQEV